MVYSCLELSVLVLSCAWTVQLHDLFIASATLNLVAALSMCALSFLEHSRSPRPSILLNGFLLLTILFDVAQTRTLWLSVVDRNEVTYARLFTATVALKAVLISLESLHKRRWMEWDVKLHSPEETSGLYGLGAFLWLNSLFISGYKKLLDVDDLFPLDRRMSAEVLQQSLAKRLEGADLQAGNHVLAKQLGRTLAVPLLLPVGPRIALTGFSFCQPFLIESLLNHLQQPPAEDTRNIDKGLIGASALIFAGIPISTAFYRYFQERALFMSRGCLTAAIYKKTTESKLSAAEDAAAVTLMSTDTERIRMGFMNLHEFWANIVEVAIGSWLLQRQLGAACVAPLLVLLVCAVVTSFLGRLSAPRQKTWMEKIEKRVGLTASVISNMKHLKISGLTVPVEEAIQAMRVDELKTGGKYRMIQILTTTTAFVPLNIAPLITFAVTARTLDVTTIFTSISYLFLLTDPLAQLFQAVPAVIAAFTCLTRIQSFLQTESRNDFRESLAPPVSEKPSISPPAKAPFALKVSNGSFGWVDGTFNLRDISVTIPSSSLTIVVGPIASGKSTFCKALLGEAPVSDGRVVMGAHFRRIGYCDQTPFLSNATIRENIVGFSTFDEKRYREVVEAAMLNQDLHVFPEHDQTKVGSNGITLSGGQKQRVSIARALYLESDLLLFDDVLSGLDADTEEEVFQRVFGSTGILKERGATAILCTHAVRHLPVADHIIALGPDGTLVEEGTFSDLVANKKYVHSLGVNASEGKRSGTNSPSAEDAMPLTIAKTKSARAAYADDTAAQARKLGDSRVYKHYLISVGVFWMSTFFITGCIAGFLYNFCTVWLKYWSEDVVSTNPAHPNGYYIGIYAFLRVGEVIMLFLFLLITLKILILRSGATLHKSALAAVIGAPLRFFTTTDLGVVTNLFSQDMTLIDGELPIALLNASIEVFISLGMAAIIASSSAWLVLSFPPIVILMYGIQKFYLRTSRQLRLLDLETKSPL
jgi:ABC-type multidrug transport system fused ATPase/permease subunit